MDLTNITDPIEVNSTFTITGAFTGASLGNTTVTQGGVTCPLTSVNSTTIVGTSVDAESNDLAYGVQAFEVTIV